MSQPSSERTPFTIEPNASDEVVSTVAKDIWNLLNALSAISNERRRRVDDTSRAVSHMESAIAHLTVECSRTDRLRLRDARELAVDILTSEDPNVDSLTLSLTRVGPESVELTVSQMDAESEFSTVSVDGEHSTEDDLDEEVRELNVITMNRTSIPRGTTLRLSLTRVGADTVGVSVHGCRGEEEDGFLKRVLG